MRNWERILLLPIYARKRCIKTSSNISSFPDDHFDLFKIFLNPFDSSSPFMLLISLLNIQITCEPESNYHHNAVLLGILISFLYTMLPAI